MSPPWALGIMAVVFAVRSLERSPSARMWGYMSSLCVLAMVIGNFALVVQS